MEERQSLLIFDSSYNRLMEESLEALGDTQLTNKGPGSITRLLLGIVNKHVSDFYDTLKREHAQVFLSKASGVAVDNLGYMLNCTRKEGESDENYKYRITRQTLVLEAANETAVRLAALGVDGVVDVVMKPYTHGAGSFSVYPILDDPFDPDTQLVLRQMTLALDKVKGYGIRATVLEPRLARVELKGRISFGRALSDMDRLLIQDRVTQSVRRYVNSLMPGDLLRIGQVHRLVMDEDPSIADVEFYHFLIDNRAMLLVDQEPAWNTRYIEGNAQNAISFA